ncbi:hypothetical protein LTR94_035142, partial [Friedmanniomyces endolithicus]
DGVGADLRNPDPGSGTRGQLYRARRIDGTGAHPVRLRAAQPTLYRRRGEAGFAGRHAAQHQLFQQPGLSELYPAVAARTGRLHLLCLTPDAGRLIGGGAALSHGRGGTDPGRAARHFHR